MVKISFAGVAIVGSLGFIIRVLFLFLNLLPRVQQPQLALQYRRMSTERKMLIYAVRTTSGQERTVVDLIASRVALKKLPIVSLLAPDVVKGYIFVESAGPHYVDDLIAGVRHARARTKGVISSEALERFIVTKPVIEDLTLGILWK